MPGNPFNPSITVNAPWGPQLIEASDLPILAQGLGLLGIYGFEPLETAHGPPQGTFQFPIVPGKGLFIARPQTAADTLADVASMVSGQPVGIELNAPFPFGPTLGGGFRLTVGEPGTVPGKSSAISQPNLVSGMIAITFNFSAINGPKQAGWSETYQTNDTNLAAGNIMMARYGFFIDNRLNLCAAGVFCTSIRFQDLPVAIPPTVPTSRAAVVVAGPPPSYNAQGLSYYNRFMSPYPTDFQGTKAYFRCATGVVTGITYKRTIWLGGLPDDFDSPLRTFMNPGPWTIAFPVFSAYFRQAFGLPSAMKMRDMDRSAAFPILPCVSIDSTGLIYFVPAHGWSNGTVINASGFQCSKGGCRPQGQYRVVVVDTDHITLRNAAASARITKVGGFRKVNWLVNDIVTQSDYTFTARKVGRPSNQQRGKSPKRLAVRA